MDFDKLLKQASVKQKVAEKKHVEQKQQKVETKKKEIEEKRKAAAKLKDMKEAARRKQLEYKGLISPSTGLPTSSSTVTPSPSTTCRTSSTPCPAVSGTTPQSTLSNRDRDKAKKKGKTQGGGASAPPTTSRSPSLSSSSSSSKRNRHAVSAGGTSSDSHSLNNGSKSSKSGTTTKSKPIPSSSASSKASTNSHKASSSTSASKSSSSTINSSAKSKPKPTQMSNFAELMKTAKMNTSSDRSGPKLDGGSTGGKSVAAGGRPQDGGKLQEHPRTSSSPVGKALLERHHSRLKNKRNFETMMKGTNPRESPGVAARSNQNKSGQTSLSSSPTKSSDLVRRPLHGSATTGSVNGIRKNGPKVEKRSLEQTETGPRTGGSLPSRRKEPSSKGQVTSSQPSTTKEAAVRGGSKASFPPLSSLTPQQIQKLKAARAAAAASGGAPPPKKKRPLNPTAFYGSAAARILQRKGEPKLSHAGSLKYTSSYVDEMMDYLQLEGVNGVDDLYSDEGEEEDFIASDDEFIDDSEECEDYSSAIRKIFGYDRRRYADYEDGDDTAMESSYAQQEFEEIRSARIGRQEDEEDIRREQQQLSKKQGKKPKSGMKQTKLSFR